MLYQSSPHYVTFFKPRDSLIKSWLLGTIISRSHWSAMRNQHFQNLKTMSMCQDLILIRDLQQCQKTTRHVQQRDQSMDLQTALTVVLPSARRAPSPPLLLGLILLLTTRVPSQSWMQRDISTSSLYHGTTRQCECQEDVYFTKQPFIFLVPLTPTAVQFGSLQSSHRPRRQRNLLHNKLFHGWR